MMSIKYLFNLILVIVVVVKLEAVTVQPSLCPTNKIAPHRRIASYDRSRPRTFGAFYDLLANDNVQNDLPSSLQEKPEDDEPDDCGNIEDYDENDLSSITPLINNKRRGHADNRFFFGGGLFNRPGYHQVPTRRPTSTRPQKPNYPPTRPPYWSGGFFGNNPYRPPLEQYPSDHIKPVHEDAQENPVTYRPGVVGGPLGHVVGVSPVRPTQSSISDVTSQRTPYIPIRFSQTPTKAIYSTRRPRPRKLQNNSNVLESFIDLFFK